MAPGACACTHMRGCVNVNTSVIARASVRACVNVYECVHACTCVNVCIHASSEYASVDGVESVYTGVRE